MKFASVLQKLRKERHCTQKEIAEAFGLTRQAIAYYELGRREPDFYVLVGIADYFGVSVDFLLGRVSCRDGNAVTIGKNMELIKGDFSYQQFSEDIGKKTGAYIAPELLEVFTEGRRVPQTAMIKVFAYYAGVREAFFFENNTPESLRQEQALREKEKAERLQYLHLAQEMENLGIAPSRLKSLLQSLKEKEGL